MLEQGETRPENEGERDEGEWWRAGPGEVLSPVSPGLAHWDPDQGRLRVEAAHLGLALHLQSSGEDLLRQENWDGGPGDGSPVRQRIDRGHVSDQRRLLLHLDGVEEPGEAEDRRGGAGLAGEIDELSYFVDWLQSIDGRACVG